MDFRKGFAGSQLKKHGWINGKGLGKHENGIKAPIKVAFKNDKNGLGVDRSEEFTFHWWDHVFNKTAKSIKVETTIEGDITINKEDKLRPTEVLSYKRQSKKSPNRTPLLYGHFLKASTLSNGEEVKHSSSKSDSASSDEDECKKLPNGDESVLDKVYLQTGLTGHKAARHGHRLTGKLKRVNDHQAAEDSIKSKFKIRKCKSQDISISKDTGAKDTETGKEASNTGVTLHSFSNMNNNECCKVNFLTSEAEKQQIKKKEKKKKKRKKRSNQTCE